MLKNIFAAGLILAACMQTEAQNTFPSSGNVGIGITAPTRPLDVTGEVLVRNRVTIAGYNANPANTETWHLDNVGNRFRIFKQPNINTGGVEVLSIDNSSMKLAALRGLTINNRWNLSEGSFGIVDDYLRITDLAGTSYKKLAAADMWSGGSFMISTLPGVSPVVRSRFFPASTDRIVMQNNNANQQTNFEVRSNMGYDAGAKAYAIGQLLFTNIAPANSDPNVFYNQGLHAVIGSASRQGDFGLRVFGIKVNGNAQNDNLYDLITVEKEHPDDLILLDGATAGDKVKVRGEICVTANGTCDYVFKDDYQLRSIEEMEQFIKQNGHLPGVKNDKEIKAAGEVNLLEQSNALLEKTEEFSLYIIELNKKLKQQQAETEKQQQENELLKRQLYTLQQTVNQLLNSAKK